MVIRAFDGEHPRLTLSDVSRRTGLTRAAARRFLLTLVELGYMQSDGRDFLLRPSVLELGFAYLSSMGLPEIALPHMEAFVASIHESSSMSVLDGSDVVYVARVPTPGAHHDRVDRRRDTLPAYATSMGRVLLAHLDDDALDEYLASTELIQHTPTAIHDASRLRRILAEVRQVGYAIVDQELEEGLRSAAAPVHADSGRVVAAVNVSVHATRATVEDIARRFVPELLETVTRISADLGALGPAMATRRTSGAGQP